MTGRSLARPSPRPLSPLLAPRSLLYAALALLLLLGGALAVSADLRSAVADRLGLPGVRLEIVDDAPTSTPPTSAPPSLTSPPASPEATPPVGVTLLLGESMTLAQAQAAVSYPIRVPASLGPPDEVYVRPVSGGAMVSLLYRARPGLPAAAETGVGALLMQFPADVDGADIAKKILFAQGSDPVGSLTELTVAGAPGYWIVGASELTLVEDPAAGWEADPSRPSANVLIWASGGITYRLETDLLLPDALTLAESLTPATPTP